jgi:ABC-type branched-subunit amino acid transport system substrate-binding protein
MAADTINAAGGIKSMGGMKLELLLGDTQTKPDVGRTEAERVVNQGAQMLMGSFDSGSTAAMVPVAQQRHVPFLVDIAAADPITANVAKAVKDGQQKLQYVYRNFPTGSTFGRKAVQYFSEIFQDAGASPKRVVLMYCNDLFGQNSAKGFQAAHAAAKPSWDIVEVIPWPEPPQDLSTEVSRAKAARPDVIAARCPGPVLQPERGRDDCLDWSQRRRQDHGVRASVRLSHSRDRRHPLPGGDRSWASSRTRSVGSVWREPSRSCAPFRI